MRRIYATIEMAAHLCRWIGGWTGAYILDAFIAVYFLTFGVGFGIWAALKNLISNIHAYSVFAKCYQARIFLLCSGTKRVRMHAHCIALTTLEKLFFPVLVA